VVPLRQRGARVIGIDISPDLIGIARERLRKYGVDAELHVGSAYDTQLPDESADVVFCMSILHHMELDRAKKEICRILKPGGLFIFREPIRFSWTMKQLRRLFPPKDDVSEFEYPLSSGQVDALVDGFQVLASRNFRTPLVPLLTKVIKPPGLRKRIWVWDAWMLKHLPPRCTSSYDPGDGPEAKAVVPGTPLQIPASPTLRLLRDNPVPR
jgi:SAM-dependent methyltransferase